MLSSLNYRMRSLAIGALLLAAPLSRAANLPQGPNGVVTDVAHIYSPDQRAALEAVGRQVLVDQRVVLRVLTLPDSEAENPKSIAARAFAAWNLGERGVLLLVVMKPHAL